MQEFEFKGCEALAYINRYYIKIVEAFHRSRIRSEVEYENDKSGKRKTIMLCFELRLNFRKISRF